MIETTTDKTIPDPAAGERPRGKPRRKSRKPPSEPKPCVIPGCDHPAQGRGLCKACHGWASKLVKAGETTWEELQAMGLAVGKPEPLLVAEFRRRKAGPQGGHTP